MSKDKLDQNLVDFVSLHRDIRKNLRETQNIEHPTKKKVMNALDNRLKEQLSVYENQEKNSIANSPKAEQKNKQKQLQSTLQEMKKSNAMTMKVADWLWHGNAKPLSKEVFANRLVVNDGSTPLQSAISVASNVAQAVLHGHTFGLTAVLSASQKISSAVNDARTDQAIDIERSSIKAQAQRELLKRSDYLNDEKQIIRANRLSRAIEQLNARNDTQITTDTNPKNLNANLESKQKLDAKVDKVTADITPNVTISKNAITEGQSTPGTLPQKIPPIPGVQKLTNTVSSAISEKVSNVLQHPFQSAISEVTSIMGKLNQKINTIDTNVVNRSDLRAQEASKYDKQYESKSNLNAKKINTLNSQERLEQSWRKNIIARASLDATKTIVQERGASREPTPEVGARYSRAIDENILKNTAPIPKLSKKAVIRKLFNVSPKMVDAPLQGDESTKLLAQLSSIQHKYQEIKNDIHKQLVADNKTQNISSQKENLSEKKNHMQEALSKNNPSTKQETLNVKQHTENRDQEIQ
ncbi:MAG: hypothetical protein AB8B67_02945 [Rickettsiaceae bacterium]